MGAPDFEMQRSMLVATPAPLMTREAFAAAVGLPIGVVIGFCNRGYLPTVAIGKYSLINVALLHKRCIEKEFS